MGLQFFKRSEKNDNSGPRDMNRVTDRYNAYFPRIFAYVQTCVGGEKSAQDIVAQAFCRAFLRAGNSDEDRFQATLFRSARRLCRPALKDNGSREDDTLNPREREVLSLVFDAGLTRDQIARMFRMRGAKVSSLLMTGLHKLKEQTSPAAAATAAHLNPA